MEGDKKNVGAPLPDEALDAVAGGEGENRWTDTFSEDGSCPECKTGDPDIVEWEAPSAGIKYCNRCHLRYRTHIDPQFQ